MELNKKKLVHAKFTNCAWAPDELVKCVNKYSTEYESVLVYLSDTEGTYKEIPSILTPSREEMYNKLKEINPDIIHFHNRYLDIDIPNIIQYHSPPYASYVDFSFKGKKLVVGQYQAELNEYAGCTPVPNIIDIYDDLYTQKINQSEKIRIGFAPSQLCSSGFESKGYDQTKIILERLAQKNSNVEIDIIQGLYVKDCIKRKSKCDIFIDECVNNGYHRNSLEAMALGKLTVCSLSERVMNIIRKMMNVDNIPLYNFWIKDLELGLQDILNKGRDYIHAEGIRTRKYMEDHWGPQKIVKIMENIYHGILL